MELICQYADDVSTTVPDWAKELLGCWNPPVGKRARVMKRASCDVPNPSASSGFDDEHREEGEPEDVLRNIDAIAGSITVAILKAMLGWQDASFWPNTDPVGIASLNLREVNVRLALCGFEEFKVLGRSFAPNFVTVQCGRGKWMHNVSFLKQGRHFNLTNWTIWEKRGGLVPDEMKGSGAFWFLIEAFLNILTACSSAQNGVTNLVFWCKAGRHRSYGLLLAFLMWACRIHDHTVWANLIAPIRNKKLRIGTCELTAMEDLPPRLLEKGFVPFASLLKHFAEYLNSEFPNHAWPAPPA